MEKSKIIRCSYCHTITQISVFDEDLKYWKTTMTMGKRDLNGREFCTSICELRFHSKGALPIKHVTIDTPTIRWCDYCERKTVHRIEIFKGKPQYYCLEGR